jgi:hypothetical protein
MLPTPIYEAKPFALLLFAWTMKSSVPESFILKLSLLFLVGSALIILFLRYEHRYATKKR